MRRALLSFFVVLTSCGGHVSATPRHAPSAQSEDAAVALARRLPGGAGQCVVARPTRLAGAARHRARWVSRAYPFAWLVGLDVRAYASASQVSEPDGERSDVVFMEVGGDPATVKSMLRANPWLRMTFEGEDAECADLDCTRTVARAVFLPGTDARPDDVAMATMLVRIRRGAWRAARRSVIDGRCAQLVRDDPGVLEASALAQRADALGGPRAEQREVRVVRSGLSVLTRIRLPDALAGASFLRSAQATHDGAARIVTEGMQGTTFVRLAEATWDDLALAEGDEERLDRALAAEASLAAPRPITEVDATDTDLVMAQADARRTALSSRTGSARTDAARELVTLLTAGHAARPDDVAMATMLVRTELDELRDGVTAAALAAEMRTRAPDEEAFSLLEREALAVAGDVNGLATALVRDGVPSAGGVTSIAGTARGTRGATDRMARGFAADVIAAQRGGARYAWAEGGVRAAMLLEAVRVAPPVAVAAARLPLAGVPAALLALLRLGAEDRWSPRAIYFRATGDVRMPPHVEDTDAAPAPPIVVHDDAGHPTLLLAGRSDDGAVTLARLGRDLAAASRDGALTVTVSLVPFDRAAPPQPEATVVLVGQAHDGMLEVSHVSRNAAHLDWDLVARFLATPLAAIPLRLYPPADVPIDARDVAEAERLADRAAPDVSCARDDAHLACRAVAGSSDDLVRTLSDMAGTLLGATPHALFERLPGGPRAVQRPR